MKKSTLFAAFAALALSASAQYTVEPGIEAFMKNHPAGHVTALVLGEQAVSDLTAKGYTVDNQGVNDETNFLYVWDGTFNAGDSSYPDPDFSMDGYPSLTVGTVGWSGAGFFISSAANFAPKFTENSILHITLRSTNLPQSIGLVFSDEDGYNHPAKLSVGSAAFNDNGVVFPLIGALSAEGEWVCCEISFKDIKRLWPDFAWDGPSPFQGNILSILAGGVTGTNFAICQTFVYTPAGENGIDSVEADNVAPVYYNLQGVRVAEPQEGNLYIKVQGDKASKVIK